MPQLLSDWWLEVKEVFKNVIHRTPEQAGSDSWLKRAGPCGVISAHAYSEDSNPLGIQFSTRALVDLAMSYVATSTSVSQTYTFNIIPYYTWS